MTERTGTQSPSGDAHVWSMISTLVAGPAVWGLIGYGVDALVNPDRSVFTAIGVVVGFVTSFYIVYVRYGRNPQAPDSSAGMGTGSTTGDAR